MGWWRRFLQNGVAVISALYILVLTVLAVLGYLITPVKVRHGDLQILELSNLPPGTRVLILSIRKNQRVEENLPWWKLMLHGQYASPYDYRPILYNYYFEEDEIVVLPYQRVERRRLPQNVQEVRYHVADVLYALDVNHPPEYDPETRHVRIHLLDGRVIEEPLFRLHERIEKECIQEWIFWFGTDRYGRDIFTRVILGARISLLVGFVAVLVSVGLGLPLGLLGGYFSGRVDAVVMWLINVVWSIPGLLFVFALILVFGKGMLQVFIAVGFLLWVEVARVVRGQVLQLREMDYVTAAKVLGLPVWRILLIHIARNVMGPVLVLSASNFATAIIIEAGLSYLGLGVQPPAPSWGSLIRDYYGYLMSENFYLVLIPGFFLMMTVLAFYQIGNGLRDALDVRKVV